MCLCRHDVGKPQVKIPPDQVAESANCSGGFYYWSNGKSHPYARVTQSISRSALPAPAADYAALQVAAARLGFYI